MRSFGFWRLPLVGALSLCVGWGAARSLYSQNAEPKPAAAVEPKGDALDELAWLTGDWVEEGAKPSVEFTCHWTRTGAFLMRAFRTAEGGGATTAGLQIVGWDPTLKQIRSWTFDEAGGFGEDHWTPAGATWSIRTNYTLPDGGKAGAIHVLTKLNDDSFEWKSVNREIDGVLQPDVHAVKVVRATKPAATAPAPGEKKTAAAPAKAAPAQAKPGPVKR